MGIVMSLTVEGMTGMGCENNVQFALKSLAGVKNAKADHNAKTVEVEFNPAVSDMATVRRAIEDMGYRVLG